VRSGLWAVGLVAVVGTSGCRQVAGIEDTPPTDLVTVACGLPYGTTSCASCAGASCCIESTACAGDPSCLAFEKCFGPCNGDPQCWAQCLHDFPSSAPTVTALSACMAKSCDSQCGLTCGAFVGGIVKPDAATECQSCIVSHACAQGLACARSASCDAVARCFNQACSTIDCQDSCELANGLDPAYSWEPDGGTGGLYGAFSAAAGLCKSACAEDWSCIGHVAWPSPTLATATDTYHFWVRDYPMGTPVPDASVTLCNVQDPACAVSYRSGTTDPSGEVSLPFQNTGIAGAQQSGLVGFLRIAADGYMPSDYYWTHSLSQSQMYSYTEISTLAEWQSLAAQLNLNLMQDPMRGIVTIEAYGCPGLAASQAGIKVNISSTDMWTQSFTTSSGVATDVTDSVGLLVFFNVPAGPFTWTTTAMAVGKQAGTGRAAVRAGAETVILAFVTP
jgi:hypothetical protein